ncbi:hypothetical protein CPT_Moby_040 [Stenotrophomonas phage Moby]|uniref:Uncharacterized protein n=1 Tax=Stenotrophomonas phage Moby TaxID=2601680 RepID=A0A5P8PM15_9CAUD|nr:hypothetical protein HWC58_gp040 [Stenotrophomonas phage Moby]QFR57788.1 hypothetical protein CPT_Moby_040 [Stenotrophomonas phage Moby]
MRAQHSFDIDGVISIGIRPSPGAIIITGRSYEERAETEAYLKHLGISNDVFYNPLKWSEKSRTSSGEHKAEIINLQGVTRHFEDDPIQAQVIRERCPNCYVVEIVSDLVELENVRHTFTGEPN